MRLPREARRRIALGQAHARRAADVHVATVPENRRRPVWLGLAELGGAELTIGEALGTAAELLEAAGELLEDAGDAHLARLGAEEARLLGGRIT